MNQHIGIKWEKTFLKDVRTPSRSAIIYFEAVTVNLTFALFMSQYMLKTLFAKLV